MNRFTNTLLIAVAGAALLAGKNAAINSALTAWVYTVPTISLRVKSMDWNFSWMRMPDT